MSDLWRAWFFEHGGIYVVVFSAGFMAGTIATLWKIFKGGKP